MALASIAVVLVAGASAVAGAAMAATPSRSRPASPSVTPVALPPAPRARAGQRALLVGSYHGIRGQYRDLQTAIDAARPGDWILVGPGDYRDPTNHRLAGSMGDGTAGAAFRVTTPDIHIRGMNRNTVWLDGTRSGPRCSSKTADQDFGPKDASGNATGRNGIIVYKVSGVSIENLSACNFLGGALTPGDEIWFDGGSSSGTQMRMSFWGSYLTATSTYYAGASAPSSGYGIYSSNTSGGPGVFTQDYGSNMNDSGFYVGACPECAVILDEVHGQDNAEGYSGTNSGDVVIEDSVFDQNRDGFDTNSQNNDDAPSPQDGTCPGGGVDPHPPPDTQLIHSCWIFEDNYVYDNNNANVPASGVEYNLPTGTGLSIYGGRHDIITGNRFVDNGGWGVLLVPYPDAENPPPGIGQHCQGGTPAQVDGQDVCYFDDYGSEIANNTFTHNGYYGNYGNADIAEISGYSPNSSTDGNCFHNNVDTAGALTSQPANINSDNRCGSDYNGEPLAGPVGVQLACASRYFGSCPSAVGAHYPYATDVNVSLPPAQATMPNPCAGVPANAWCPVASGAVGCPQAFGRLTGRGIGPLALGISRTRARRLLTYSTRGHRYMDFFCLTPNGIRVGYPTPLLLSRLSPVQRSRLAGRVILTLTANRHYALDGVRPGTRLASAARRLRVGRRFRVGRNDWYLTPNGPSHGLLKVRHGIIEEIGIAYKALTGNPTATRLFLRSFG